MVNGYVGCPEQSALVFGTVQYYWVYVAATRVATEIAVSIIKDEPVQSYVARGGLSSAYWYHLCWCRLLCIYILEMSLQRLHLMEYETIYIFKNYFPFVGFSSFKHLLVMYVFYLCLSSLCFPLSIELWRSNFWKLFQWQKKETRTCLFTNKS